MELTFIKERQLAGIKAAKRKGIYKGRSKMVDEAEICKRMTNGSTKAQIARDMGVSRMTVIWTFAFLVRKVGRRL
jgi:DNA invertase Pin-like site-specific DNA recombinase